MHETSASLLDRLRDHPDAAAWDRLVDLYTPLIRGWLLRQGLPPQDADDVVQDVMQVLVRKLPLFQRQRIGSFRAWLRNITVNCLRDFRRARRGKPQATGDSNIAAVLDQLEDPHSGLSREWDADHDRHVTRRLLELIRPDFTDSTWRAFERLAIDGASPEAVAGELGISTNAAFIAKSRVLRRLREEAGELVD
jgi:RNA polymerase sigma-70 factor (ECF subfamily)